MLSRILKISIILIMLTGCAMTSIENVDDCGLYYMAIAYSEYPPELIIQDGQSILDAIPESCR